MFRYLFLLTFLLQGFAFAQKDTTVTDRTLEGVHKKSSCDIDTVITVYKNKILGVEDSLNGIFSYRTGTRTYVEITMRATMCFCRDCSFADHVMIDVTGLKPGDQVELSPANTTWAHWNSLMMVSFQDSFTGTFTYEGADHFKMEIFRFLPTEPPIKYDGILVVNS